MSNTQENWKAKVLECCNNSGMCAFACLVPFGCSFIQCMNSKLVFPESRDYIGAYFCTFLSCFGLAYNRSQLRSRLKIEGNYCFDCMCHGCCTCCSLVQEWREVMLFKYNNERLHICNYSPYEPAKSTEVK